jgi:hypothetical protein
MPPLNDLLELGTGEKRVLTAILALHTLTPCLRIVERDSVVGPCFIAENGLKMAGLA